MTAREAVVQRIKYLCKKQNISFYTLAYRSAIPKSTLMNIFLGTNPTIGTISKICNGFGISMLEFFSSEEFDNCEED